MSAAWTIRDGKGEYLPQFAAASALEVGRRILPTRFDAFRLHVAASYREVFDRAVAKVLAEHDGDAGARDLPRRLAPREPAANDVNVEYHGEANRSGPPITEDSPGAGRHAMTPP